MDSWKRFNFTIDYTCKTLEMPPTWKNSTETNLDDYLNMLLQSDVLVLVKVFENLGNNA